MRLAAVVCASLALAGCAQIAALTGVSPATVQTAHVSTGQALALAYDSLDSASLVVEAAVTAGILHGPNAAKVATDLGTAKGVLDTLNDAYQAGTATNISAALAKASAAIADAKSLAKGGN